jgi:hypothetical protein
MSKALSLILILAMASIMSLMGTEKALSQECSDSALVYLGNPTIEPCSLQYRINIPVYMNNPCLVGGFTMQIYCSDPSWASFDSTDSQSADTIGSRISGWELFNWNLSPGSHSRISVTAIANLDGQGHPLFPGDGLIFTVHPHLKSYLVCDTCQILTWGNVNLSDTTGLRILPRVLQAGAICVAPGPCDGNPRGDANCNGAVNGIDVVFLVNYFRGSGRSFCCLCSADVNGNGQVNGIDVTYLVNYLRGRGPAPPPCN